MELVFQFRLKNERASGDSLAGGWGRGIRMKGYHQISGLDNKTERGVSFPGKGAMTMNQMWREIEAFTRGPVCARSFSNSYNHLAR